MQLRGTLSIGDNHLTIELGDILDEVEEWRLRITQGTARYVDGFSCAAEDLAAYDVGIGIEGCTLRAGPVLVELMLVRFQRDECEYWRASGAPGELVLEATSAFSGSPFECTLSVERVDALTTEAVAETAGCQSIAIPTRGVLQCVGPHRTIRTIIGGDINSYDIAPTHRSFVRSLGATPEQAVVLWGEPYPRENESRIGSIDLRTGQVHCSEPFTSLMPRVQVAGDHLELQHIVRRGETSGTYAALIGADGRLGAEREIPTDTMRVKCISWKSRRGPGAVIIEQGDRCHTLGECCVNSQDDLGHHWLELDESRLLLLGERVWVVNVTEGIAMDHGPALENYGSPPVVHRGTLWGPDGSGVKLSL